MKLYKVTGQGLNADKHLDEIAYYDTYNSAEILALQMSSYYKDVVRTGNKWVTPSGRVPLFIECVEVCDEKSTRDEDIAQLEKELGLIDRVTAERILG